MNGLSGLKALTSSNLVGMGQYFNLPTIGGLYSIPKRSLTSFEITILEVLDMFKFGIPIYPDTYEESGGNDISEQVLVGGIGSDSPEHSLPGADVAGALVKVADNIVVNPRKWRIHGYTGFNFNTAEAHKGVFQKASQELMPDVVLQSFISKFGRDTLNATLKKSIQYISEARRPFKFNTRDGETVPCLIKSYNIKNVAENSNFVELDLEIQEFRFLALTGDEAGNIKSVGGITSTFSGAHIGRTTLRSLVF